MQKNGVIASFGNASGAEFAGNVLPFILRGVRSSPYTHLLI